ncbi:MAG: sensor histidine kinase [Chloroflexota bacterium]
MVSRASRLRTLQWLTVLVPAVCAGLYETVRHSLLATELPSGIGTALAVALVLSLSLAFARVSFGIIRRMEADLLARNRDLQALSRQVERLAVMEERDRLAREMHDSVAQVLAYLLVRLDTIEGLVERGRAPDAAGEVRRLRDSAEEAYADVREAIAGLRTRPDAGPQGLAAALRAYTEQFADRTGIKASFEASGAEGPASDLSSTAEVQFMRIAQEALANVRKHAGATQVVVRFWRDAAGWNLTVVDNGGGFDPTAPPPPGRQHFGLPIMHERAQSLRGRLVVTSRPGAGTTIHAQAPAVQDAVQDDGGPAPAVPPRQEIADGRAAALARG